MQHHPFKKQNLKSHFRAVAEAPEYNYFDHDMPTHGLQEYNTTTLVTALQKP